MKSDISERMFYCFLKNKIPAKNSLLAICITLDMSLEEIEKVLFKAGYVLSNSIILDVIIKKLLKDEKIKLKGDRLIYINNILFELKLPLLMTREKKSDK